MKKILIGYLLDGSTGGIDKYLMNLMQSIPFEKGDVQVDFLTNQITDKLKEAVAPYHSRVFEVATLKHPIRQYKQMVSILNENQYDIAYFNISTALHCVGAAAAKKCGVEKRIIHSHASGIDEANKLRRSIYTVLNKILAKTFVYKQGTDFYACSETAGLWVFPEKIVHSDRFHVIKNTVNVAKYAYSPTTREAVRKEMGLENKFVLGNVAIFAYYKNHDFLLKVFQKVHDKNPKAVLMLVGDGVLFDQIVQKATALGLKDSILFLGQRNDVDALMQAMDVFLLPSIFEGFGIVGIEAQVSGLHCVFSDRVPREVAFTDGCAFLEINKKNSASVWAKQIESVQIDKNRHDACEAAEQAGYSLKKQSASFLLGEDE